MNRVRNRGSYYNHDYSPGEILDFGVKETGFHVSPQYRQDRIRKKAERHVSKGRMTRVRKKADTYYHTTEKGIQWFVDNYYIVYKLKVDGRVVSNHDTWQQAADKAVALQLASPVEDGKIKWGSAMTGKIERHINKRA